MNVKRCTNILEESRAIFKVIDSEYSFDLIYFDYYEDEQLIKKCGVPPVKNNILVLKKAFKSHPNKIDAEVYLLLNPCSAFFDLMINRADISSHLINSPFIKVLSDDNGQNSIISFITVRNGNKRVVSQTTIDEYGRVQAPLDGKVYENRMANSFRNTLDMACYLEEKDGNKTEADNIKKLIEMLDVMKDKLEPRDGYSKRKIFRFK